MISILEAGLDWLLIPGGPFLPNFPPTILENTRQRVISIPHAPYFAVCAEIALLGTSLNQLHQQDLEWLVYTFNTTPTDLLYFLYGYTTPPLLVMGGKIATFRSPQDTYKIICPASKEETLITLNGYKAYHLQEAQNLIASLHGRDVAGVCEPIYDLCFAQLFDPSPLYKAGILSSWTLLKHLCTRLDI